MSTATTCTPVRSRSRSLVAVTVALTTVAVMALAGAPAAWAAGGTATSSLGTFAGTTAAMTDGNLATSWKSFGAPGTSDWVRLDQGAVVPVKRVDAYLTDAGSPADRIEVGVVEVSTDGTTWTWLGAFSNTNEVHVAAPAGTTARYVRLRPTVVQNPWIVVREISITSTGATPPTPPVQPASGPGGTNYPNASAIGTEGGTGNDAWWVFQPTGPQPASAPVAVIFHGYGEYSSFNAMFGLIAHTVRKGSIVIYPRWQTGLGNPLGIEATMTSARNGIVGALNWLKADPTRVQPQTNKVNYLGWSYGGIIATNLANRDHPADFPAPRSLMLIEPHDGFSEGDLDDSLAGISASTKLTCYVSDDVRGGDPSGCKTIFPLIGHIPAANKDYVTYYDDTRGSLGLIAAHQSVCSVLGVPGPDACGGVNATPDEVRTDAVDFYAFWKSWVALQSCANADVDCAYGINDTPEHRTMGTWSDGVAVRPMRIGDAPAAP